MTDSQPAVAGNILAFVPRPRSTTYLSPLDRVEVARWGLYAATIGFDRAVIHAREAGDTAEVGEFVALHREGEAWAHYLLARRGAVIIAWCGVSSADIGEFRTMGEAFRHVLAKHGSSDAAPPAPAAHGAQGVVTDLMPRLRRAAGG